MALSAPTLAITDAENAGGVTATLTGGDAAADNLVKYASFNGELGSLTWSNLGFRTGPGTVSGTASKGYFVWHCISSKAGESVISNLVYQNLTDGEEAVQERILAAVLATMQALALPGIAQTVRRKMTWGDLMQDQLEVPACVISACEQQTSQLGGSSAHDLIGKPAVVMFITGDARQNENEPRVHAWMQAAFRAFNGQRLAGVPEVMRCDVQPALAIAGTPEKLEWQTAAQLVQCQTWEPRGFGA